MANINIGNCSKSEQFMFFNTLTGLVKNLENKYTTIDLRNECLVIGKIVAVDGIMNIEMEDVMFYDSSENCRFFPSFYIKSRNIRRIHIPERYNGVTLLQEQFNSMYRPKRVSNSKKIFKVSRAQKYQAETTAYAFQKA
ncbi:putative uncharacterized protein DDB_G0291015 [Cylas formicarius]|uniref:putative uncharacterized protein DDB_G0291015 n=1 Tax=Cylas formicarius TaxID=197179 RepID=UPI0029589948|nr:putative uncharacterized protein DDB_G0291015 [Cylas formicarius]